MMPLSLKAKAANPAARWYLIAALCWLVVLAALGLMLRLALAGYIAIDYNHWLHGHSHIAFLGWIFNALVAGYYFSVPSQKSERAHRILFMLIQLAVLGMAVTFPIQGYGLFSIAFSTLYVILAAVLAIWSIGDGKRASKHEANLLIGYRWWIAAIVWMLISSLGPFALGYFMANDLGHTPAYQLSIYFYLHFQYNGWFFFGLIAVLLLWLARSGVKIPSRLLKSSWWLFTLAMPPAYALSALWLNPAPWVWWVGGVAAFIQLVGLAYLTGGARKVLLQTRAIWSRVARALLLLAGVSLCIKLVLQMLSVYPDLLSLTSNRLVVIAYLHLIFLGIISNGLLGMFWQAEWIKRNVLTKLLLELFVFSFAMTEVFMLWPVVFQQMVPWDGLLWSTVLLSVGLGGFGLAQFIAYLAGPKRDSDLINLDL